jgi:hypothetical protein
VLAAVQCCSKWVEVSVAIQSCRSLRYIRHGETSPAAQALVINRLAGLPYPMWNAAASINPVNED